MFEIYSFCRAVDDIADDPGPREPRRGATRRNGARDIDAVYRRRAAAAACRSGAGGARRSTCSASDFLAVIDGMEMDVVADIRAPDRATLDLYCDRVACAVGRLSVRVFGMEREAGLALAHHLGRALQLTNILRDLDEDAGDGPALSAARGAARRRHHGTDPAAVIANPAVAEACAPIVALAQAEFDAGRRDHGAKSAPRSCGRRGSWARPIGSFSTA